VYSLVGLATPILRSVVDLWYDAMDTRGGSLGARLVVVYSMRVAMTLVIRRCLLKSFEDFFFPV
jgi:hypothetical protein